MKIKSLYIILLFALSSPSLAKDFSEQEKVAIEAIAAKSLISNPEVVFTPSSIKIKNQEVFNKSEVKAIESIVKNYIVNNPDVLVEAGKVFEKKLIQEQEEYLKTAIDHFKNDPNTPSYGPNNANDYVIEFFDYNCGYCKIARKHAQKFIDERNARVIYIEYPILSKESIKASAIGLALYKMSKEKYKVYIDYLMSQKSKIRNDDDIKKALDKVGVTFEKAQEAVKKFNVIDTIKKNLEIGQKLGIAGTPVFIINNKVFKGAIPSYDYIIENL